MPVAAWPGTKPDATERLAVAVRKPRPSIGPPDRATRCDRCLKPLGERIYSLVVAHVAGTPATWFVCAQCRDEFLNWFADGVPLDDIGGTK